jgi:hypothetical protein
MHIGVFAFCSSESKEPRTMHETAPITIDTTPARGWTPALKARFLDRLAAHGNARAACRNVGISHESAYRLRRRDAVFARGWAAAVLLARENGVQVLAERAIEGIEEKIYHRGQLIDTRRRYDTRLLLAHLARLDKLADDERAGRDAARFDELLACIADEQPPGEADPDELLPLCREMHQEAAADDARDDVTLAWMAASGHPDRRLNLDQARHAEYRAEYEAAAAEARVAAVAEWDAWFARACAMVDAHAGWPGARPLPGLPGNPLPSLPAAKTPAENGARFSPRTLSHVSTSALARALAGPVRDWPGIDLTPRLHTSRGSTGSPAMRAGARAIAKR